MTVDEMISVLQAFKNGETIQELDHEEEWQDTLDPAWDFPNYAYRVKPKHPEKIFCVYHDGEIKAIRYSEKEAKDVIIRCKWGNGDKVKILTFIEQGENDDG